MQPQEAKTGYSKIKGIEGWFRLESAMMIGLINNIQKNNNVEGNIFEVGVLYGKSSLFLSGLLNSDKENIEFCDVFLNDEGFFELNRKEKFYKNINDFIESHGDINYKVHECSSKNLNIEALDGDYRLFHIDGCHDMEYVSHDFHLALHTMVDYGVIIIDDFLSPLWPGVSEAVILALTKNEDYSPFLIAHDKLYVCKNKYLDFYLNIFDHNSTKQEYLVGHSIKTENLLNVPVNVVYKPWTVNSNALLNKTVRKIGRVMANV